MLQTAIPGTYLLPTYKTTLQAGTKNWANRQ